jgi:hypothetical protein
VDLVEIDATGSQTPQAGRQGPGDRPHPATASQWREFRRQHHRLVRPTRQRPEDALGRAVPIHLGRVEKPHPSGQRRGESVDHLRRSVPLAVAPVPRVAPSPGAKGEGSHPQFAPPELLRQDIHSGEFRKTKERHVGQPCPSLLAFHLGGKSVTDRQVRHLAPRKVFLSEYL